MANQPTSNTLPLAVLAARERGQKVTRELLGKAIYCPSCRSEAYAQVENGGVMIHCSNCFYQSKN